MFEWLWIILIVIGSLGVITLLFAILAMVLAAGPWHFTRIEKGHIVFINRGDTLKVMWPDVGNYRISDQEDFNGWRWLIKDDEKENREKSFYFGVLWWIVWLNKLLWNLLGIRFVSFLWPHIRVHRFKVSRKRLLESSNDNVKHLKDRVVDSPRKDEPVSSLLFLAPRPIYLEGIELAGDNAKINLLLLPAFQPVIPALPVYYLEGDFFPLLDAAVQAAIVDFCSTHLVAVDEEGQFIEATFDEGNKKELDKEGKGDRYKSSFLTYDLWRKLPKGGGSPMEKHLRRINVSRSYYQRLKRLKKDKKDKEKSELATHLDYLKVVPLKDGSATSEKLKEEIGEGIIPRFGFALVSFRLVDWEEHLDSGPLAKALRAKETQKHEAEGVRQKASGEGDAFRSRGKGEASRYDALVQALIAKGVSPNVAAEVVRTQIEMEQLHGSGVVTYVRGQAGVLVPAQGQPTTPPTSST